MHNLSKRADFIVETSGLFRQRARAVGISPFVSTASLMSLERLSSTNAGYPQIPSPYYGYDKNVL